MGKMKRITKLEDVLAEKRSDDIQDYSFNGSLIKNKNLIVLPANDPVGGVFGCLIFDSKNDDDSMIYSSTTYGECEEIICDKGEDFFRDLEESLKSNYPTFICDDPIRLKVGFISLRNNGNKHFLLGLSLFKKWVNEKGKNENT
jgi:hypothetical protein